jgi:hypothetical protein
MSGTSTSLGSDMDHDPVSYRSCTIVLPAGNGFGIPATMYYVNVGHSFLWCPYVLHVVHQTTSILSLFLFWFSWNVKFFRSSFNSSMDGSVF